MNDEDTREKRGEEADPGNVETDAEKDPEAGPRNVGIDAEIGPGADRPNVGTDEQIGEGRAHDRPRKDPAREERKTADQGQANDQDGVIALELHR